MKSIDLGRSVRILANVDVIAGIIFLGNEKRRIRLRYTASDLI